MTRSKVAVLRTRPDRVLEDYRRLMSMGEVDRCLAKDQKTILKDNISWHFYYPGANTTPWQLEGAVLGLRDRGYADLVAVHNNTVVTDPYKGEKLNKLDPIYRKYGIEERFNFLPDDIRWVRYQPRAKMLALDMVYPDGIHLPEYFFGKNIVHLPTVKCHIYTTTTGAMKNAFGGLLNTRRHYTHTWIHETLVDLLAIQQEIHSGLFALMDGTTAGSGPGPRTMIPFQKDLILASGDQVAIDAVAAKLMGFDPMSIKYIRLAHEAGLGAGRMDEIEIVGEDISRINWGFQVGDNVPSLVGDFLWFGPMKRMQKLFFHTPLVYLFVFASFFYHDYIWYPWKGKRVVEAHRSTSWGQLFDQYAS